MLDFTSVLYLDFRHPSAELRPWSQLTTGVPAALAEPVLSQSVAGRLARLQGCEQSIIAPSTLHLFWDLFTMLADEPITIYLDSGAYPVAGWGAETAAARGAPVHRFPHKGVEALARAIRRDESGRRPVVVADGVCAGCGCVTPVDAYVDVARRWGGLVILDDTQALGLLGQGPTASALYGFGGGGTLRYLGVPGPDIMLISSLAKGFGAPLAAVSGSDVMMEQFRARSRTRVHNSPASMAALHAADGALRMNEREGDWRRGRLARLVKQFRGLMRSCGLEGMESRGGLFPIQTLKLPPEVDAGKLHGKLLKAGVRTILRRGCGEEVALSCSITARHRPGDLMRFCQKLMAALKWGGRQQVAAVGQQW